MLYFIETVPTLFPIMCNYNTYGVYQVYFYSFNWKHLKHLNY